MTFTSIPPIKIQIGKPLTADLMQLIKGNLDDLNVRIGAISLNAGSPVFLNQILGKPKDSLPVGSIVFGSLTAAQFTAETDGGEWVAADGANVSTSDWAAVTGRTVLPDARGRFIRTKDNAAGVNTAGDLALDSVTADTLKTHLHDMGHGHGHTISAASVANSDHTHALARDVNSSTLIATYYPGGGNPHYLATTDTVAANKGYQLSGTDLDPNAGVVGFGGSHSHTVNISGGVTNMTGNTGSTGATETAPRYITENAFIKINRAYIGTNTRQFVLRVPQQTTINNILLSPVSQGTSGNLVIDIKKGNTIATATQTIFQSGQLPTLAWNGAVGVTGLTDSAQNTVAAGQFLVVSITSTQTKLRECHLFISGDN